MLKNYLSYLNLSFSHQKQSILMMISDFTKKRHFIILSFSILFALNANAQTERKFIRQGNSEYNKQKYNESELLYRKAIDAGQKSSDALFNLGDALYKQKNYEEATKNFTDYYAAATDTKKKANSQYNLGNSLLKSQKIEESIAAYKNSLKLDPKNTSAKYNLAYAQDLLKKQQEEQQQQQQQQKDQNADQNSKNQNQNNDKEKQSDDQKTQQQQTISKEDAERLLTAVANDENKVQEKVKKDKAEQGMIKTLKNW